MSILTGFEQLVEAIALRFKGIDKEIKELRDEIKRLKQEPHRSFAQRVKAKR